MNQKNIGGYDENAMLDRKTVNFLEGFLLESKYIVPYINSADKIPNLDGYIELCVDSERKIVPIARFEVQVKSLNHDYTNDNKIQNTEFAYKYSCDTKVINVVLSAVTMNPVLLLLVDSANKRIFYKYMSYAYCVELNVMEQYNKTIYFDDSDEISDLHEWISVLKEIHNTTAKALRCAEDNYYLMPKSMVTVPEEVQDAWDYINQLMDNEFWFIKNAFFSDTWKFGIAYLNNENATLIGLYKIKKGENGAFIKVFEECFEECFTRIYYHGHTLHEIISSVLEDWIKKFFDKSTYYWKVFPDKVLIELLFENIDSFFTVKEMQQARDKSSFIFGWPNNQISLDEVDSLEGIYHEKPMAEALKNELIERGYSKIERIWEPVLNYKIESIDDFCISFEAVENRLEIDKRNMQRFLSEFVVFYNTSKQALGRKSFPIYSLKNKYRLIVADDFSTYFYGARNNSEFAIELLMESDDIEKVSEVKNAWHNDGIFDSIGSGLLSVTDYSWHKLWCVLNKYLCLKYIGSDEAKSIMVDYMCGY